MRLIYLEAADKISTLLGLITELQRNFYELEFVYNLIFRYYETNSNKNIEDNELKKLEAYWKTFPSDFIFLNILFEVSKNIENFMIERSLTNYIFKEISVSFLNSLSEMIFRVKKKKIMFKVF